MARSYWLESLCGISSVIFTLVVFLVVFVVEEVDIFNVVDNVELVSADETVDTVEAVDIFSGISVKLAVVDIEVGDKVDDSASVVVDVMFSDTGIMLDVVDIFQRQQTTLTNPIGNDMD